MHSLSGQRNTPSQDGPHMSIEIHHLLDHAHHLPTVAAWQHAEFGYLSPGSSEAQRAERFEVAEVP